jgi:hypothetical protein
MVNDRFVENVCPYDARGRPLTGVQPFDQNGRPLDVTRDPANLDQSEQYRVTYPWRNGTAMFYNVFPLPQRGLAAGAPVRGTVLAAGLWHTLLLGGDIKLDGGIRTSLWVAQAPLLILFVLRLSRPRRPADHLEAGFRQPRFATAQHVRFRFAVPPG